DSTDRVTPIDVLSVQSSDAPDQYETSDFENGSVGYLRIKIGDPDRTITGHHTYVIKYRVQGALNGFRDHDELSWNAVGGNWPVIIDDVTATVHGPSGILQILCVQGATGSSLPCTTATTNENSATFAQDRLFPFWGMTITIAIPKGAVPTPAAGPRGALQPGASVFPRRADRRRHRRAGRGAPRWLCVAVPPIRPRPSVPRLRHRPGLRKPRW